MEQAQSEGQSLQPGNRGTTPWDERKFSKLFLLFLFILSFFAFLNVIQMFLLQIVLAAVFATLFYPFYRGIVRLFRGNRGWSALACCILLILGLLIPMFILANVIVQQAVELYQASAPRIRELLQGDTGIFRGLQETRLFRWANLSRVNWEAILQSSGQAFGSIAARVINKTSQATLGAVLDIFIIFFTLFYFFRDGEKMLQRIKHVVPLNEEYKNELVERFSSISRATVRGTLIIGLIQGALGALTLFIFGVSTWLLWGFVMTVLSILPVFGPWMVMIPAGIIMIAGGHVFKGIMIIAISIFVVSTVDNLIRPNLVGRNAEMHDLIIFFSTLGGIIVYGVMGFIVGPMIAAIFLTILDIYSIEFQSQLAYSKKPLAPAAAPGEKREN